MFVIEHANLPINLEHFQLIVSRLATFSSQGVRIISVKGQQIFTSFELRSVPFLIHIILLSSLKSVDFVLNVIFIFQLIFL